MRRLSATSDAWNARLYEDKHSFVWQGASGLLEMLAPMAGERILDLGCGTGHLTVQLAAVGVQVVGIDLSQEMIAEAVKAYPALHFEVGDARSLEAVEAFDAVFSNAALHWIKEAEQVVCRIARALKPGGRFVAEFGGKGNIKEIRRALQEASGIGEADADTPWYFPSVSEYTTLLEKHGLEVTFATLFYRPTALQGEEGMRDWIRMFGGYFLKRVEPDRQEEFVRQVEATLRPTLYQEGTWYADYRRLRVVAQRTP
jgi:trans-aconitate methyltransferase